MAESEVARIRAQIELECEAVKRGLYGLAAGAARHECLSHNDARVAALGFAH